MVKMIHFLLCDFYHNKVFKNQNIKKSVGYKCIEKWKSSKTNIYLVHCKTLKTLNIKVFYFFLKKVKVQMGMYATLKKKRTKSKPTKVYGVLSTGTYIHI